MIFPRARMTAAFVEIAAMHRAQYRGAVTRCRECGREWPCDSRLALEPLPFITDWKRGDLPA